MENFFLHGLNQSKCNYFLSLSLSIFFYKTRSFEMREIQLRDVLNKYLRFSAK